MIAQLSKLDRISDFREKLSSFRDEMLKMPGVVNGQQDINKVNPIKHTFVNGCYIREVYSPANEVFVTKIHKKDHVFFLLKGDVTILTEDGIKKMSAPTQGVTIRGTQRLVHTHSETLFYTVHSTNKTTVQEVESEIYTEDKLDPLVCIESLFENDFEEAVSELGYSLSDVDEVSNITSDLVPMPKGLKVTIMDSSIHGKGVFATEDITSGESVGLARIDKDRTPIGRYLNHSKVPNGEMIEHGKDVLLIAIHPINSGAEITVNYRQVVKLNKKII